MTISRPNRTHPLAAALLGGLLATIASSKSAPSPLAARGGVGRPPCAAERLRTFLEEHPESGVFGYPGEAALREHVESEFRRLGLEQVRRLPFETGSPVEHYARLDLVGDARSATPNRQSTIHNAQSPIPLHCFWPNMARTCTVPREGIAGKLLYAGSGRYAEFDGHDVNERIVVLDLECGTQWLNAFELGANAVVFLPSGPVPRQELEAKLLSLPLNAPRFWVPEAEVEQVRRLAEDEAEVRLYAWQEWRRETGYNVLGKIAGTDPELQGEHVILAAHYDRISAVPALAPGAGNLVGLAALLDLVEELAENPPKRTVVFLATSGHYVGMAGMGAFVRAYDLAARDAKLQADIDPEGERSAQLKLLMARYFDEYQDEKKRPLSFLFSLDLSAGASRVGVFHFGAFEENRDLYRERRYAVVGRAVTRQTEALETAHGLSAEQHFADGINPKKGKSPESYFSELPAFESELASLVLPGLAWATCSDDRDFVDTPFDTLDRLDSANAEQQIDYLRHLVPLVVSDPKFPLRTFEERRLKEPLFGRSVWWDKGGESFFADTPVPHPVVVGQIQRGFLGGFMRSYPKPVFGVHMEQITVGGVDGKWSLENFLWPGGARIETYGVDPLLFAVGDLKGMEFLAERLGHGRDRWEERARRRFSEDTQDRLKEYFAADKDERLSIERPLVNELNAALQGDSLLALGLLAGRKLPSEVRALAEAEPEGIDRIRLNRCLLHAAYPDSVPPPPQSGDLVFAPDRGEEGDRKGQFIRIKVSDKAGRPLTQTLFRCAALDFVNLWDPRQLQSLKNVGVLQAPQATEPLEFGFMLPLTTRYHSSYVEPCATIFAAPDADLCVLMGGGVVGHRLVLIRSSEEAPFGVGVPATATRVPLALKQVADDLYRLDQYRLGVLAKHGIESEYLNDLHAETRRVLDEANQAAQQRQWSRAVPAANRAWALESTVYPATLRTSNDVVKGVLFYLMLALPFAYFLERLLFGLPDIRKQIMATVGVFALVMAVLAWAHPAFSITFTPFLIFLAFLILTLAVVVSTIVVTKFQGELKQFRGGMRGVQEADVNRAGALSAAINLGVANMRRRPVRTWLTCTTIVLLTFTVLSFTSIRGFIKYNKFPLPWPAPFEGIMLRNLNWGALEESEYRGLLDSLSDRFDLTPRYWHVSRRPEEPMVTEISIAASQAAQPKRLAVDTIVGLGVNEPKCLPVEECLTAGRWFEEGEGACLMPDTVAAAAGVTAADVGQATVAVFGTKLRVCGLFDSSKMDALKGLGDEPVAPVNFLMFRPTFRWEDQETHPDALALEDYLYWPSSTMLIVPAEVLAAKGGTLHQIMAVPKVKMDLEAELSRLLREWSLILYVGQGGEAKLYSSLASSSVGGLKDLFIPVLIAAIIVLNTMLGSVYERVHEIGVYNSVGLSPVHIASLFLAEATVYATIGAILGYLLGQVAAKLITVTGLLPGLTLNYSSGAAVMTILFVILVVILSSLYPARQATRMAVPDLGTSWQLGEPEGDKWAFRLPFQVSVEQALDMAGFMHEFFSLHREQAVGNFYAQGVTLSLQDETDHPRVTFDAWLAPYDFGVSHHVEMWTEEVASGTLGWRLDLTRLSGDVTSWKRATQMFLKRIRKQLLMWRTVPPDDRRNYREIAVQELDAHAARDAE